MNSGVGLRVRLMVCGFLGVMMAGRSLGAVFPPQPAPTKSVVYKTTPQRALRLFIFDPSGWKVSDRRPAMVFFHGGGWVVGAPPQFYGQAANLSRRGMVAISVAYRLGRKDKTTPFDSVKDAFSAMRWIRGHARSLGIDPNRIAAGGGSAGGQLAAALATLTASWTGDGSHLDVSPRPDALVLFNPVVDNGPHGYGYARVKAKWQSFSPMANVSNGMPPTLVMLGTQDQLIPMQTAEGFRQKILGVGGRCDLVFFAGGKHGFFNREPFYDQTMSLMDNFLHSLGYLPAPHVGNYMQSKPTSKGG